MITLEYFLVFVINLWFPPGPWLSQGLQPPNIPPQYVYLPIAPGTDLRPQGPVQYPTPPPAPDPGQSRFFRHYHGGRR